MNESCLASQSHLVMAQDRWRVLNAIEAAKLAARIYG